jgi:hypothetical protein
MRKPASLILALLGSLALAGTAVGGGQAPVRDGQYAGGADRLHVYFQVSSRTIPYVRVWSKEMGDCTGLLSPGIFDAQPVGADGRFTLRDDTTFPGHVLKATGRFVTATKVRGLIRWTTSDPDCPGTHVFEYRADRYTP